jgi:alpha,alpha-trehalase
MSTAPDPRQSLSAHIQTQWPRTFREPSPDGDNEFALVAPCVVPTPGMTFKRLYYWDTYYTLLGLRAHGFTTRARQTVECLIALCERLGYVPNSNLMSEANRSQPPHLALAVRDVLADAWDEAFARRALAALDQEWRFWTAFRSDASGLAAYGTHAGPEYLLRIEAWLKRTGKGSRIGVEDPPVDVVDGRWNRSLEFVAECESGWDFTPRFANRCRDHLAVDLNALLFGHENICADICAKLGEPVLAERWRQRAALRRERMQALLWSEELGAFVDRDRRSGQLAPRVSAAGWYALWLGVATPEQAARSAQALRGLEEPHGIVPTAAGHGLPGHYQWDHPNAWAPHQWAAVQGCLQNGLTTDARRIAATWVATVERNFTATGCLWEKYNAVTGKIDVVNEYEMPEMFGWTAGVYVACVDLLAVTA